MLKKHTFFPQYHNVLAFLKTMTALCTHPLYYGKKSWRYGKAQSRNIFYQRLFFTFILGCLPRKILVHQWLSSITGCLPSKVVLDQISSSIKGCPPIKSIFHQRLSSIKGCLPAKVVVLQRCLQSKFVFH